MKCNSCGTEIESGAARCPNCGADVGSDLTSGAAVRLKTDRSILLYVIFGTVPTLLAIIPFVFLILCLIF